jgi:diguanylate cyclase (GGDEF)-like protein
MLAGVAVVAWLWRLGLGRFGAGSTWLLVQAPLTICAAALAWRFASNHEHRWILPARTFHRLLEEIRQGQAPIESLNEITGPIAPLVRQVQELLGELRQQKQELSRLHWETSARVRNRTDALEGKLRTTQTQATRDVLTGLGNRRAMEEQLPRLLEQCRADGTPLCVLSIDVDHFKSVNDTQGHTAGDRLLRDVGHLIHSAVRDGDRAYRLGGDEFLIVMPGCDWPAGKNLARRLASMVDQLVAPLPMNPKPGLSIGITCPGDLRRLDAVSLLHEADKAMYCDKSLRKKAG